MRFHGKRVSSLQKISYYKSEISNMNKSGNHNNTIPAVEKTLAILNRLGNSDGPMTRQALSRELGITQSTGYRILQTLLKYNWIRESRGNAYELGNALLPLLLKMHRGESYWEQAQEILDTLAGESRLSCKLSVRQGAEQLTLARADSPGPFGISGKAGSRFPLIEGSVGAALLLHAGREEILSLAELCGEDIAEKRDPELLIQSIRFLKEHHYILNSGKNRWKIGALSKPVCGRGGEVIAAITLLGLPGDFTPEKLPLLLSCLNKAVDAFRQGEKNII